MQSQSSIERLQLAQKIAAVKPSVGDAIARELRLAQPAARRTRQPDAELHAEACGLHIDFLSGAIDTGAPEAFADYLRWTVAWHLARGVSAQSVADDFVRLEKHLTWALLPGEREALSLFLTQARSAWRKTPAPVHPEPSGDRLELTRNLFLNAILAGQRWAAVQIVEDALVAGHSHLDLYADLFTESLYRVGELWLRNKITVAQEHVATSVTQYAIASMYPVTPPVAESRGSMVVTGVSGEQHQIGANLVADAMEAEGWSVRFLGSDLPHSSVLTEVEESSANVLCISTTIVANLPTVGELVRGIRNRLQDRAPQIVLGGSAYRTVPHFAQQVGAAPAFTDLRRAIARLCA